ncbi:MAG: multidrug ABC transporter substrate-binding protein [Rhodobacteraceae bacterium PARR1]|nr:MAG: multidrug ABC transporter substrate-binding protein [Rhodobacteraceae bacterium PARR1]
MLWETVRLAFRAIIRNKLRSFLTVLGVVIGVAAVIAMVTIGQGSSAQVAANVASLGNNVLSIRPGRQMGPGTRDSSPRFTLRDAEALARLSVIGSVSPQVQTSQTVVSGNLNVQSSVNGVAAAQLEVGGWTIAKGRVFSPVEEKAGSAVCVIGETVRKALFGSGDPVDQTIRIKGVACSVIGLLSPKGAGTFGQDQDSIVWMPVRAVQRRLAGGNTVDSIGVTLAPNLTSERGIREIETLLRERRRIELGEEDNFSVTDMKQIASMLNSINSVLAGMLSSVAAVSLLVGGIGIMNIMLVSVTERTREIGIRLAVGATSGQVLTQFLVEAVVLSILGGVIGIAVGLGLAYGGSVFMSIPFAPSLSVVVLAFCFSAVVGVVFGFFPARRAARLDPIEALRHQ